jgi:hypothetical protein
MWSALAPGARRREGEEEKRRFEGREEGEGRWRGEETGSTFFIGVDINSISPSIMTFNWSKEERRGGRKRRLEGREDGEGRWEK